VIQAIIGSALFDKLFPWVCGVLVVFGVAATGYGFGYSAAKKVWQAELATYKAEVAETERVAERAREMDRIRRAEKGEEIAEVVVVKEVQTRTVYRNIIKKVTEYVPSDACHLPPGWRLLHDAAAEGRDPEPAGSPNAAPVAPQDAAETVIDNYESCRINAERLSGLQQWVREVAGDPK
jgi:hypothetical protein